MIENNIHEPYELRLIDLAELQATVKKDKDDRFFADIKNPKYRFNPKFNNPHLIKLEDLRIVLKLNLFYYKLNIEKSIRYCKVCNYNLILDSRKFVDLCDECSQKEENYEDK